MAKKALEIRDMLAYRYPENLQYSTNGTYLAFQVASADEEKNRYHRDVWLVKDGKAQQFTATLSTNIVMWNDDTHLVVTREVESSQPGTTDLYLLDVNGGEAVKWLSLPLAIRSMKKISDGLYAVLAMIEKDDPDAYKDNAETRKKKIEDKKKEADYQVVDEVPYWFNGAGFINGKRTALFIVKTGEKQEIKRVTPPSFNVDEFTIDGTKIYYTGALRERRENMYSKVYAYDVASGKRTNIYTKETHSIHRLMVIKGKLYCLASDMKEYGVNQTSDICEVRPNEIVMITDPHRQLHNSLAGDTMLGGGKEYVVKKDTLYTLATEEDHIAIWKFDNKMRKTVIFDEMGAVFFMDVSDHKIAFARETQNSLGEVYEMNLDGSEIKKLTNLNGDVLKDKYVAKPKLINYQSGEEKLHGWVLLPQDFDKKKKYPAVLDVHGGPRCIYGDEFFHEMQVWANRGYVVMFTNIRGSDGRDDEFADIRHNYGYVDFENLMDFVDAVLKKYPNIDQSKLCETGGSYGGFMTNWIIGHTDRFCCAASQRSISNWISMSFISDIGLYFGPDQCGAKGLFGDENTALLWEHSPLKYAENVKTPTLFIHSDEDYRCPLPEGMQMMQALAFRNVETRMVIFHGENHELSRSGKPQHRIRRLTEITDWFDKHTK